MPILDGGRSVSIHGSVIPADVLETRILAELAELGALGRIGGDRRDDRTLSPIRVAEQRADRLHHLWHTVVQPRLVAPSAIRGRVARVVKRIVWRMSYWYVEPRWEAQREIDAEVARFASDCAALLADLQARVEFMEKQNQVRLRHARQVARATEAGNA